MTTNTEGLKPCATESEWQSLAACMYQAAGAYDMPVRFLDALSAAQSGEPFAHLLPKLLPVACPAQASEAIPDAFDNRPRPDSFSQGYVDGWNGYRDALLKMRALSTMPVEPVISAKVESFRSSNNAIKEALEYAIEPVTNPHFAIHPEAVDAPLAITVQTNGDAVDRLTRGDDPSETESIVACLRDDAAWLLQANPDDEKAQNMVDAANLIEQLETALMDVNHES